MDLSDPLDRQECVLDLEVVDVGRGGLQQHSQGLLQDRDGGGQHNNSEDDRQDGVDDAPIGLEIDHDGAREDTDGLDEVAHHVDESSCNIQILPQMSVAMLTRSIFYILGTWSSSIMMVVVTMAMLVEGRPHQDVDCHPYSGGHQHDSRVDFEISSCCSEDKIVLVKTNNKLLSTGVFKGHLTTA